MMISEPAHSSQYLAMRAKAVVIVAVVLIALVAVYEARQRTKPVEVTVADEIIAPSVEVDQRQDEAAHVATCEAVENAIDATMEFDREYAVEELSDGTIRLMTAAMIDGRQVDVRAVVQWDDGRREWTIRNAIVALLWWAEFCGRGVSFRQAMMWRPRGTRP